MWNDHCTQFLPPGLMGNDLQPRTVSQENPALPELRLSEYFFFFITAAEMRLGPETADTNTREMARDCAQPKVTLSAAKHFQVSVK